jgi:hypothetical protein
MKRMSTGELQIAKWANKHKGEILHSQNHFIDEALLNESYRQLNMNSAAGIDGEHWYEFGIEAAVRIPELLRKFKAGEYRIPMIRRVYRPKGDGGQRPLGINTVEDMVLKGGARKVLEPINEGNFKDFSYGFRSGRSSHQALHPDKTKLIDLECERGKGDRSYDFLGFTHYKGLSRQSKPVLKRKTSSKKLTKAITQTEDWIKQKCHRKLKALITELNAKLRGHYSYYGMTFNYKGIDSYYEQIKRRLHKWLNRRGGRKWNWEKFSSLITKLIPLVQLEIYHKFLTAKPILEEP